jgi:hypothetical protein
VFVVGMREKEGKFFVVFIFAVALVCGESSVNINDTIFFKLDNFSILFSYFSASLEQNERKRARVRRKMAWWLKKRFRVEI